MRAHNCSIIFKPSAERFDEGKKCKSKQNNQLQDAVGFEYDKCHENEAINFCGWLECALCSALQIKPLLLMIR
jgi:hypothetical protein